MAKNSWPLWTRVPALSGPALSCRGRGPGISPGFRLSPSPAYSNYRRKVWKSNYINFNLSIYQVRNLTQSGSGKNYQHSQPIKQLMERHHLVDHPFLHVLREKVVVIYVFGTVLQIHLMITGVGFYQFHTQPIKHSIMKTIKNNKITKTFVVQHSYLEYSGDVFNFSSYYITLCY